MASVKGAIRQEVERLTGGLADRVGVLGGRLRRYYRSFLVKLRTVARGFRAICCGSGCWCESANRFRAPR